MSHVEGFVVFLFIIYGSFFSSGVHAERGLPVSFAKRAKFKIHEKLYQLFD